MVLTARDVMQHSVGVVEASASLADLEAAFVEAGVSGFPVVEGGRVVGVVSRSDVLHQLGRKGDEAPRLSTFYADLGDYAAQGALETFADATARGGKPVEGLRAGDLMTPSVITVAPDASIVDVAGTLVDHAVHRVLVTDGGTLVGLVSSLDVVRTVAEGAMLPA